MKKIISKLFPLLDHLYIFQSLEYEVIPFLKWFLKHPFKRNLQKKHSLELTNKAVLLAGVALGLIIIHALVHTFLKPHPLPNIFWALIIFLVSGLLSPLYLILASLLLYPLEFYQKQQILKEAARKIDKLKNLKKVAIIGSFGKTSTKEILYTLLWKKFRAVKTPKSYNTQVSVARSIISDLKDNTEIFLAEMDAYHPGEIDKLVKLVKPQIAIITSIAPQHLERFGSMESLAKTQFEVAKNLPEDGVLFLNSTFISFANAQDDKIKYYGLRKEDDLYATNIEQTPQGLTFLLHLTNSQKPLAINLPLYGEHHVQNFLAASSIALSLGLTLKELQLRAQKILPTPHRLEVKKQENLTIIDNSYNTNPISSKAALKLLKDYPGKQKIIITPGLVELGKTHFQENVQFAKAASLVADQIIIVGENAKAALLAGLKEVEYLKNQTHFVKTLNEGLALLSQISKPEAVVLLENDLPDQYF